MNGPEALAALPPARRAELIYTAARSEMTNRLWRAALGDGDRPDRAAADPLGGGAMSMQSLLELVSGGAGAQPVATEAGHGHCCCAHHHAAPGGPAAPAVARPAIAAPRVALPAVAGISADSLSGAAMLSGRSLTGASDALPRPAPTPGTLDLGPNARFADAIHGAANDTGLPPSTIAAIIDAEAARNGDGSWNPLSRNPRSSAAGLGQFLSGTWQDMAQTEGSWLNRTAEARGWLDEQGRVRPQARAALLQLRYDPEASIRTTADFARLNLDRLEADGIRVRTDGETTAKAAYLSHHLGVGDARRFLGDGIVPTRARMLLRAQIGPAAAEARIADAGGATRAHRQWLLSYIDRRIRPERFEA